jgi:hypothetical protein
LANATNQLNARRSAMLLRCQRGREDRRRIDFLRAERARSSAVAAEISASEQRDAHNALRAARLEEAHEAIRGRVVDLDALKLLTTLEQDLQKEAVALEGALTEAHENLREAELVLTDAATVLRLEVKATHRRERLAGEMLAAWRRATEAAAETEREDQVADKWSAA